MAHQIENMFSVGETPWHGLGQVLPEAPTVADAIKQAGLDWKVIEVPLFTHANGIAPVNSHKALMRETDNSVLGVVGNRYKPLQNAQAFDFFDPLVASGLVSLETAGSLQAGKRVWVMARVMEGGSDISIIGDDIIRKYILLSNSHDGTMSVRLGFTPIRVVCANTLAMAHNAGESQLIRLRHSSDVSKNLEKMREIMSLANKSFEATADQFRALASHNINQKDLYTYVKTVLGHAATSDEDLSSRASNQIGQVISLFETGRGMELKAANGTVWGAYNAVTEFLSHSANIDSDKRYNSLWFGQNAQRNQLALGEALKLAA